MLKLLPTKDAAKFIEALPAKQFRQIWLKVLDLLRDPIPSDSAQLVGYTYRRADIGEYRIIYDIAGKPPDQTLRIILIGKRNGDEVYEKLKRLN